MCCLGINKPGGIARITAIEQRPGHDLQFVYSVKYVLDSITEHAINDEFIKPYNELSRSSRRKINNAHYNDREHEVSLVIPKRRKIALADTLTTITSTLMPIAPTLCAKLGVADINTISSVNNKAKSYNNKHDYTTVKSKEVLSLSSHNKQPVVILTSGLNAAMLSKVQELALQHCCSSNSSTSGNIDAVTIAHQFHSEVTHLVVPVDKHGVLQQRTMKYLQALVCKLVLFINLL